MRNDASSPEPDGPRLVHEGSPDLERAALIRGAIKISTIME
jgi:hypothetical protein